MSRNTYKTSETLKQEASQAFKNRNYHQAIELYSRAIDSDPKNSVLYSNRGLCYMQVKNFMQARLDGVQAISKDKENIKGYIVASRATASMGKDETVEELKEALRYAQSAIDISFAKNVQTTEEYCKELIYKIKAIMSYKLYEKSLVESSQILSHYTRVLNPNLLKKVQKVLNPKQETNYLESLICPVSLEMFQDPVVIVSGITYEKSSIQDCFAHSGVVDPVTRQDLSTQVFYENKNIKQAVKWYINSYPWLRYCEKQHHVLNLTL